MMFEFDVLHYNDFYTTLDIDFDNVVNPVDLACTKEKIEKIVYKISKCKNLTGLVKEDSNKKGYHLRLYCKIDCCMCRLVFDDTIRYNADLTRQKEFTNIIFDKKRGY